MIQRIQTILLAAATLLCSIAQFFKLWTNGTIGVSAWQTEVADTEMYSYIIGSALAASALLSAICIFDFKNRARQIRTCQLTVMILLASVAAIILLEIKLNTPDTSTLSTLGVGVYMIALAVVSLLISIYFIRKDEDLVRSVDRFRE